MLDLAEAEVEFVKRLLDSDEVGKPQLVGSAVACRQLQDKRPVFELKSEGDRVDRVLELARRTLALDIDELSLADSTGMANPLQVETMIEAVRPLAGDTPRVLHLHDTRSMGLVNVYAALRQGVTRFDTAFGGLGGCPFIKGATGNIATEDTLYMLNELGVKTGIDVAGIAGISRELETYLDTSLPAKLHHLEEAVASKG